MSKRWRLLVVLAVLAASCAVTPDPRTREGDMALDRGKPERAWQLYEAVRRDHPDNPLLAERISMARRAAADDHLAAARRLEQAGRYQEALAELKVAARWAPNDAQIAAREQKLLGRQTREKAGVSAAIADAKSQMKSGEIGAALATLAEAKSRYSGARELADAEAGIRKDAGAELVARAKKEGGAGRPALALLYLEAASDITGNRPAGLDEAEAKLASGVRTGITVGSFSDSTGGRVAPGSFEEEISAALAKRLPALGFFVERGGKGDLTLTGAVTAVDVGFARPKSTKRNVEYVARVEEKENPARPRLEARERQLESRLSAARSVHDAAKDELDSLERLRGSAVVHQQYGRRYGPYSEAAYYRYLGDARAREALTKRSVDSLDAELQQVQSQLSTAPVWLERPVKARATIVVTIRSVTATAKADFRLEGAGASGSFHADAEVSARDESHPALSGGALAADPNDLPDAAEMAHRAVSALAEKIAASVAVKAADRDRALLASAEQKGGAGDSAGSLDRYAAFLFSAGFVLPVESGTAAREIQKQTGIRWTDSGVDLSDLRLK